MSQALIVWLCASLLISACGASEESEPAPAAKVVAEEQLERLVPALVDAVQTKQPVFVMDHVAAGFKEARGLDYFDLRSLVESSAFREEPVGARLESLAITPLDADKQRVEARVVFALGRQIAAGSPPPDGAVTYALDVVFEKHDAVWRAVSGSYRRE
ncbi:MAG: hypothetical protein ACREJT_04455 [Myxococcota bacterium]